MDHVIAISQSSTFLEGYPTHFMLLQCQMLREQMSVRNSFDRDLPYSCSYFSTFPDPPTLSLSLSLPLSLVSYVYTQTNAATLRVVVGRAALSGMGVPHVYQITQVCSCHVQNQCTHILVLHIGACHNIVVCHNFPLYTLTDARMYVAFISYMLHVSADLPLAKNEHTIMSVQGVHICRCLVQILVKEMMSLSQL